MLCFSYSLLRYFWDMYMYEIDIDINKDMLALLELIIIAKITSALSFNLKYHNTENRRPILSDKHFADYRTFLTYSQFSNKLIARQCPARQLGAVSALARAMQAVRRARRRHWNSSSASRAEAEQFSRHNRGWNPPLGFICARRTRGSCVQLPNGFIY